MVSVQVRTVFIDAAHNGVLTAGDPEATTNAAGHYAFTDLGPGTYVVRIEVRLSPMRPARQPTR